MIKQSRREKKNRSNRTVNWKEIGIQDTTSMAESYYSKRIALSKVEELSDS
jgi:hypothetical protein